MRRHWKLFAFLAAGCLSATGYSRPAEGAVDATSRERIARATVDLGLNAAFEAELKKIGPISADEFGSRYPRREYLAKPSWDPTTAKFWDRLMSDPANGAGAAESELQSHPPDQLEKLRGNRSSADFHDFRLNDAELVLYRRNGFVVSERMGSHSFTDLYHRIYVRDLPVFVTADSMLHAWHRQFDRIVEGLETEEIQPALVQLLAAMARELPAARKAYGNDLLEDSLEDVDFFLCVARRLLDPAAGAKTAFDQEARVEAALAACDRLALQKVELFGADRVIDFSRFKPRGRYDQLELTKQYFRGVMWLGRIDFRLAGTKDPEQELRELGAVVVLNDLLVRAGGVEQWREVDRLLQRFIGQSDCLNFTQVDAMLRAFEAEPAAEMSEETLEWIHQEIGSGRMARQQIRGDYFCVDPSDPEKFILPMNFAFLGQRFVLDSWALSKVVYDDIEWAKEKVHRRVPSSLDVSFAVFANDQATPWLHKRLTDMGGRKFRDGLPYQHNLVAARQVIDALPESTWDASVYAQWLGCLRELSRPTTDGEYPEAMQTEAWAEKVMTTQLASWTQLRHDTVLYAKPSYSSGNKCYYPAGYVEPVPHFWQRFDEMVRQTADFFEQSQLVVRADRLYHGQIRARESRLRSLNSFAAATGMLRAIAEKQLAAAELSADETKFLQEIVVRKNQCGAPPIGGWYPQLFSHRSEISSQDDAHKWTALVADIHTDPPDQVSGDPGCVLHEGVGNVELLVVTIDSGEDRVVYAGPVFSHYEFEASADVRLTNGDWHDRLRAGQAPAPTLWSGSYRAPGMNAEAASYGLEAAGR